MSYKGCGRSISRRGLFRNGFPVNGVLYFAKASFSHFNIIALLGIVIGMIEILQMLQHLIDKPGHNMAVHLVLLQAFHRSSYEPFNLILRRSEQYLINELTSIIINSN